MIILNERAEAERIIETGNIGEKPSETLLLLARYYYNVEKLTGKKIYNKLNEFMQNNYPKYDPKLWEATLQNKVKKADKYPLTEINDVVITRAEMETIKNLKSPPLERLAFTLLCLAKFGDKRNMNNNGWVCRSHDEIFKIAAVPATIKKQAAMLNSLYQAGLIGFSMKVTNTNIQVLYIQEESYMAIRVSDFRELGHEYMNYLGKYKYIRCAECGRLTKCKGNARTKYCKNCSVKVNIEQTRMRKLQDKA